MRLHVDSRNKIFGWRRFGWERRRVARGTHLFGCVPRYEKPETSASRASLEQMAVSAYWHVISKEERVVDLRTYVALSRAWWKLLWRQPAGMAVVISREIHCICTIA